RISVASRIGLTCIDSGLQRVEEALREADIALSFAKRQPAQPIVAYTPGMGGAAVSLVSLEADLHVALDRRQFRLLFQPIVDLRVNLSAASLRDPGLREYVAQVLQETHTSPRQLKFELTEVGLISNVSAARELLNGFHSMGIELMLDDFGTGYSSLSYLQLFPFSYVKIDRPLLTWTASERSNNAITSAILQMTSNLGLRAVAEVVETQAAAQALQRMGCDFGQGYFFCEPVEAEEALHQVRTYNGPPAVVPVLRPASGQGGAAEVAGDYSPTLVLPQEDGGINDDTVGLPVLSP